MPKAPEYSDYGGYTGIKFKYTFGKSDLKEANNEGVYQFKRDLSNNQTKVSATVQASISDPKRRNNTAASWWSWFNSSGKSLDSAARHIFWAKVQSRDYKY
jgi:hypothetical protein